MKSTLFCIALVGCTAPDVGPRLVHGSYGDVEDTGAAPGEVTKAGTLEPTTPDTAPAPAQAPEAEPTTPEEVPEGSFVANTMLVAIADVNIRSGEGTTFDILGQIPAGTRVKVLSTSGSGGWVNITYQGKVGFSIKSLLSLGKYSPTRGKKMADRALALWNGKSSRNLCLAGVDDTAETSGAIPEQVGWLPRQPSAVDWQAYVAANADELLARGYVRENLDVNHLPKGAIIGWRGGQCGYHAQYGHIEVVVDDASSRACSDYCGSVKKNCGDPLVFIPID